MAKKYLKPQLMGKVSNKQQELVGGFNPFEKHSQNGNLPP